MIMLPVCRQSPDPVTAIEGGLPRLHGKGLCFIEGNPRVVGLGTQEGTPTRQKGKENRRKRYGR